MERLKVLVLGHNGMLGHMVKKYLEQKDIDIFTIEDKWPSEEFQHKIINFTGNFIINCIGSIPQKTTHFETNYNLPVWLSKNTTTNIIHPGTDCEMDFDEYGISKKRASDYIKENSTNTKILKASIIGPELYSKSSLMEWFLNSENKVNGYKNAFWNGITTLEWAKQCLLLISEWNNYQKETIIEGECLSKYDLLNKIKNIFDKNIEIIPIDNNPINKCLSGNIKVSNIEIQLIELKKFYYNENN